MGPAGRLASEPDARFPDLAVGPRVLGGGGLPPARRALRGGFVELQPLEPEAHAAGLYEASHGSQEVERLWVHLLSGPYADLASFTAYVEKAAAATDQVFLAVLQDGKPIGVVSFLNIEPASRCVEVGNIWYSPAGQRSKVNTESIFLMLRHAFEEMGCRRVEWKCNALNEKSRSAAQRLGFSFEGIALQHRITKGRNRDTAWFGMLDGDWPTVKSNMERWLCSDGEPPSLAALNKSVLRPVPTLPGAAEPPALQAIASSLPREPDPRYPDLAVGPLVEGAPGRLPGHEAMGGRFLELQPLAPERHGAALFRASHGAPEAERLWTYLPHGPFAGEAEFTAFLEALPAGDDAAHFAILGKEGGEPLGMGSYLGASKASRTVELALWVSPLAQTPKAHTETAFLMLRHAFEEMGCRRVEWRCDALHEESCQAAQRLGFSLEGIHLHHRICKGRNRDTAWFGMLDGDWPKVKSNMERWLYSEP